MEMTIQTADFKTDDFSNPASGQGIFPSMQILTPIFLGLLTGPGVASGAQSSWLTNLPDQGVPGIFASAGGEAASTAVPAGGLVTAIREGWRLNMTELAEIFGVSRPTLYNWLKGKPVADPKVLHHLQVLAAAAGAWKHHTDQGGQDFLLDYTGPQANEESIRQAMTRPNVSTSEIVDLIHLRLKQYQEAYAQSRTILGEPMPVKGDPIHESTRKLNKRWTENAQRLHQSRNSSR